ncbi:MAG: glycosyltransferase family 2 protein [Desulfomonilia bacterium]
MNPLVSVVIPVFNGTNFLTEAINSVLSQTFTDYEVLVVDDGSTDGTWEIIKSYGDRVRGFCKPNGGVASALNLGIKEMRGRWFAWLSHDDLWLPEKLERQVAFLKANSQFKACYTDFFIINDKGERLHVIDTPWYPRERAIRELFRGVYINGSTILIERSCFDRVGLFSEKWRYNQDTQMWLRLLRFFEIGRVADKLVKQRVHAAQDSRNVERHRMETLEMFKEVFNELQVKGLFPHLASSENAPSVIAMTHTWFGESMARSQKRFMFAYEQYLLALQIFPSWRNPAWYKIIINTLWMSYWFIRRSIQLLPQK